MDATQTPTAGQSEPAVTPEAAAPWVADPECDCSVCESANSAARWATLDAADPAPTDEEPPYIPDDSPERLSLTQLITRWAARFRLMDSDAGELMADALNELATDVRSMRAETAAEFWAKRDCWEDWREEQSLRRPL